MRSHVYWKGWKEISKWLTGCFSKHCCSQSKCDGFPLRHHVPKCSFHRLNKMPDTGWVSAVRCTTGSEHQMLQLSHGRILVYSLAHQDVDLATGALTEQNKIGEPRVLSSLFPPPKKKPVNAEQHDCLSLIEYVLAVWIMCTSPMLYKGTRFLFTVDLQGQYLPLHCLCFTKTMLIDGFYVGRCHCKYLIVRTRICTTRVYLHSALWLKINNESWLYQNLHFQKSSWLFPLASIDATRHSSCM